MEQTYYVIKNEKGEYWGGLRGEWQNNLRKLFINGIMISSVKSVLEDYAKEAFSFPTTIVKVKISIEELDE